MYRMIIVTALGNYVVEMVPEKEEPTADELMKMFLETKADVESGCFMEGWTPTDGLSGAPGVFAIGKGLEILAYHVERRPEFDLPPINPDTVNTRRPLSIKFNYLGNEMTAKCIQDDIGSVAVIFCYYVKKAHDTIPLDTPIAGCTGIVVEVTLGTPKDDHHFTDLCDDCRLKFLKMAVEHLERKVAAEKEGLSNDGEETNV